MTTRCGSVEGAVVVAGAAPGSAGFLVRCADEVVELAEGERRRFGRGDAEGDITVWEQVLGNTLSVTAGELWCSGGQAWVRNLSTAHEVVVDGPGVPSTVLPPRDGHSPGHACSVPWPEGSVSAPSTGRWRLLVEPRPDTAPAPAPVVEVRLPRELEGAARALCAPLLDGARDPAAEVEVAAALGVSRSQVREQVRRLAGVLGLVAADDGGRAVARALVASSLLGTVRVDDVPDRHRDVAEALCAPLLLGSPGPATYADVAAALGTSARVARRRTEALVEHYEPAVRALPGGVRPDETLTAAVARLLVHRGKLRGTGVRAGG